MSSSLTTETVPSVPTWRRYARFGLRLGITVLLLGAIMWRLDLRQIAEVMRSARAEMLLLMLLSMLVERFYATYRWYVLLRCGDENVSFFHLLRVNFASGFLGSFIPSAGIDVLRVVGEARRSQDPAMAFTSVALDRYLGVLALTITALVGLAVKPVAVAPAVQRVAWPLVVVLALGFFVIVHPRCRSMLERLLAFPMLARLQAKLQKVLLRLDTMRNAHWVMLWSLLLAFGVQFVRIASVFFGARALGIEAPLIYFAVTVPIIIFIQVLPISIGGFGTREFAFVYFLSAVGVAAESAFALSLLVYLMTTFSNLPGAWMSFTAFSRNRRPVAAIPKVKAEV